MATVNIEENRSRLNVREAAFLRPAPANPVVSVVNVKTANSADTVPPHVLWHFLPLEPERIPKFLQAFVRPQVIASFL